MTQLFPVMVFDTETTFIPKFGKENPADGADQPHIMAIAAALIGNDGKVMEAFDTLIKPRPEWRPDPEALAINGLTLERCEAEGISIEVMLTSWVKMAHMAAVWSGFNVTFDLKMMRGELRRAGREDLYGLRPDFCCMWGSRLLMPNKKNGTLAAVHAQLLADVPFDNPHTAVGDRDAAIRLYLELVKRGAVEPKDRFAKKATAA